MKNQRPIAAGCVVRSKAGRDEGRYFIVLSLEGEEFAYVADGKLRKVEKPKKKKRMHLRALPELYSSIAGTITDGSMPSNAEVRRCLADRPQRED